MEMPSGPSGRTGRRAGENEELSRRREKASMWCDQPRSRHPFVAMVLDEGASTCDGESEGPGDVPHTEGERPAVPGQRSAPGPPRYQTPSGGLGPRDPRQDRGEGARPDLWLRGPPSAGSSRDGGPGGRERRSDRNAASDSESRPRSRRPRRGGPDRGRDGRRAMSELGCRPRPPLRADDRPPRRPETETAGRDRSGTGPRRPPVEGGGRGGDNLQREGPRTDRRDHGNGPRPLATEEKNAQRSLAEHKHPQHQLGANGKHGRHPLAVERNAHHPLATEGKNAHRSLAEERNAHHPLATEEKNTHRSLTEQRNVTHPMVDQRNIPHPMAEQRNFHHPLADQRNFHHPLVDQRNFHHPLADQRNVHHPLADQRNVHRPLATEEKNAHRSLVDQKHPHHRLAANGKHGHHPLADQRNAHHPLANGMQVHWPLAADQKRVHWPQAVGQNQARRPLPGNPGAAWAPAAAGRGPPLLAHGSGPPARSKARGKQVHFQLSPTAPGQVPLAPVQVPLAPGQVPLAHRPPTQRPVDPRAEQSGWPRRVRLPLAMDEHPAPLAEPPHAVQYGPGSKETEAIIHYAAVKWTEGASHPTKPPPSRDHAQDGDRWRSPAHRHTPRAAEGRRQAGRGPASRSNDGPNGAVDRPRREKSAVAVNRHKVLDRGGFASSPRRERSPDPRRRDAAARRGGPHERARSADPDHPRAQDGRRDLAPSKGGSLENGLDPQPWCSDDTLKALQALELRKAQLRNATTDDRLRQLAQDEEFALNMLRREMMALSVWDREKDRERQDSRPERDRDRERERLDSERKHPGATETPDGKKRESVRSDSPSSVNVDWAEDGQVSGPAYF